MALTPVIPRVILDENFEVVINLDDLALHCGRERFKHGGLFGRYSSVILKVILCRDPKFHLE